MRIMCRPLPFSAGILLFLLAGCGRVAAPSVLQAYDRSGPELKAVTQLDLRLAAAVPRLAGAVRVGNYQSIRRYALSVEQVGENLSTRALRAHRGIARLRRSERAPGVSRYILIILITLAYEAKEGKAARSAARIIASDPFLIRGTDAGLVTRESRSAARWARNAARGAAEAARWKAGHPKQFRYVVVKHATS